jgi:hydrogenase nickel incorporation protein HypA/HybF
MHELAIAEGIVEVAERHAAGRRVYAVDVTVGHLRQVVPAALEFGFELVARGTTVEGAELRISEVPAAGRCRTCGHDAVLDGFPFACGACGGLDVELTAGGELLVESLELDEPVTTGGMVDGNS